MESVSWLAMEVYRMSLVITSVLELEWHGGYSIVMSFLYYYGSKQINGVIR